MANFIAGIISLTIGAVIMASVFITTIKAENVSTWSTAEQNVWGLLTLMGIVGLLYGVLNVFGLG